MYIVTGGAGFLGSAFIWKLNTLGIDDILVVDDLGESEKWMNLRGVRYRDYLHKDDFLRMVCEHEDPFGPTGIVHMGASSATTVTDANYLMENNYRYTQAMVRYAVASGARLVNASSAATYGDGAQGFSDAPEDTYTLKPLNMYGYSKHLLDLWALRSGVQEEFVSLKFFNVFGPNEYHKGSMTSVALKAFEQIAQTGRVKLFKSHRGDYSHGGQTRDFVYVKDCVEVMWWLMEHREVRGIYNLGTGTPRTFADLATAVFTALGREAAIDYIDMPEHLQPKYQYYTCADTTRLREAGCDVTFAPLEESVADYVTEHLQADDSHLTALDGS